VKLISFQFTPPSSPAACSDIPQSEKLQFYTVAAKILPTASNFLRKQRLEFQKSLHELFQSEFFSQRTADTRTRELLFLLPVCDDKKT
jgi:hypothetical protein